MKAKTKFIKMFYKLPEEARTGLIFNAFGGNPMSLGVICIEVRSKTELGKRCLVALGYKDDVKVSGGEHE